MTKSKEKATDKDIWDKAEIVGKILLAPVLVGIVGLLVGDYQRRAETRDKEFELALTVASTPEFISSDPLIVSARSWAKALLTERLGTEFPDGVFAAAKGGILSAISPQTAFTAIQSGEITQNEVLKDPRFKNCPSESIIVLVSCVGSVLRFIGDPKQISFFPDGPVDFGEGILVEKFLTEFNTISFE